MRTKVTFILLFLNAALFLFIFRFERDWRTERADLEVRRRVLGSEAADIRSLEVERDGAIRYRLERRGDAWFLTDPIEWPANLRAVDTILTELQFLDNDTSFSVKDVEKNGLSLSTYGLEHPRLVVTFTSGGPDTTGGPPVTTTLDIGDTTREGQRQYLLSPDRTRIHVIGRELADDLSLPLNQLRADTVLTIPVFEARSLTLQGGGVPVHVRREGAQWLFDTPIPARANKHDTELAISRLDALRVKEFVPADPAALPSADPQLRVTIEGNDRTETLLIGRPVPGPAPAAAASATDYDAQFEEGETLRPPVFVVAIPRELMETLRDARDDLRERRILDFDPSTVTAITLAAPNQKLPELTLQRLEAPAGAADGGWQILLHGDGAGGLQTLPADRAAVAQLLQELARLSAEKFQSDAPQAADLENWGFNRPEREITLAFAPPAVAAGAPPEPPPPPVVLQIGLPTERDGFAYARLTTAPSIYAVNPDILSAAAVLPQAWRQRLVRALPADARIAGLKITDLADGTNVLTWADGSPLRPSPVLAQVLDALRTLRARTFVQDGFSEQGVEDANGEDHPWRYRIDAAISLPAGAGGVAKSTSSLWLTERLGGDLQIAGSPDLNAEFTIEQPFLDALWTLLHGARDSGALPPADPSAAR